LKEDVEREALGEKMGEKKERVGDLHLEEIPVPFSLSVPICEENGFREKKRGHDRNKREEGKRKVDAPDRHCAVTQGPWRKEIP